MAPHPDYPRTRLFTEQNLAADLMLTLEDKQAHYLSQVLRLCEGDAIAFFNGRDGEWQGVIESSGKKAVTLSIQKQLRPQHHAPDLWLLAAPLKNSKTEWVIEKATELGIAKFCPVTTQFTVVDRIKEERLMSIAIEASEQCERLDVPTISPLTPLVKILADWSVNRQLIYGDESGVGENVKDILPGLAHGSYALLIGPEGGFSATELELLRSLPYVTGMCMGPRVMRADTAAIAALTLLQAACGDWDGKPAFRTA